MFEDYVRRLCREMGEAAPSFQGIGVKSVFFGGGTPSILPPALMGRIMDKIMSAYDVNSDAEISMEANPGTLDAAKLREYKSMYFNRLSMGLQADLAVYTVSGNLRIIFCRQGTPALKT